MSRSDRGFAVFARKNVGFADKRVAAPAKGKLKPKVLTGDYPLFKTDTNTEKPPEDFL